MQMRVNTALVLGTLLASGVLRSGGGTPSKALLVLAKSDHTLSIVDPASLHVGGAHAFRAGSARSGGVRRRKVRLHLQLRRRGVQHHQRDRPGGAKGIARGGFGPASRTSRASLRRWQSLVHRGSRQGDRQLRSDDEEGRLGAWYGPGPNPHDF